jgi:uncharacterized protein (TIGR02391 family)
MRPVRFSPAAEFEERRRLLNERLLLSGFEVAEDGSLHRARAAAALSEAQRRADDIRAELSRRGVHPDVLAFCRAELMQQNYFHAVLEAAKSVADKLRTLTGVSGDGSPLVDATCSLSSGPPRDVQQPGHRLGAIRANRYCDFAQGFVQHFPESSSPRAEGPMDSVRRDALDMLTLASMLHRRLDDATVR